MNRKDIALTVGGVLATMVLAYMFYRHQEQQAAATAAPASSVDDGSGLADALAYYQVTAGASSSAAVSVPTLDTSSISSSAPSTSSAAAIDPDTASLLSQIISAYGPPVSQTSANLLIPTLNPSAPSALASVPTSAGDAINQAVASLPGPVYGGEIKNTLGPIMMVDNSTGLSTAASSAFTSHPVNLHPLAGAA